MPSELIFPAVESGNVGGIWHLRMDEHDVVQGIAVKTAHGLQIASVPVAFKQLLDALLNAGCNLSQPVFVGLFFSHGDNSFQI